MMLHHHAQPFRGTRDAGVEPSRAAVLERKALVEQHHVVPLRALRFVHREHVAVIELVIGLALLPRDGLDRAAKAVAAERGFCYPVSQTSWRGDARMLMFLFCGGARFSPRHSPPLKRPFLRLLRKHTSLS